MSSTLCPAHSSLGDFHRRVEVRCVCAHFPVGVASGFDTLFCLFRSMVGSASVACIDSSHGIVGCSSVCLSDGSLSIMFLSEDSAVLAV